MNHWGLNLAREEDVDAAVAAVLSAGGSLIKREEYEFEGVREPQAYVKDPDGYIIELCAQRVLLGRKGKSAASVVRLPPRE